MRELDELHKLMEPGTTGASALDAARTRAALDLTSYVMMPGPSRLGAVYVVFGLLVSGVYLAVTAPFTVAETPADKELQTVMKIVSWVLVILGLVAFAAFLAISRRDDQRRIMVRKAAEWKDGPVPADVLLRVGTHWVGTYEASQSFKKELPKLLRERTLGRFRRKKAAPEPETQDPDSDADK